MHGKSPRSAPRLARKFACAAVALPVLLVAGCSSDSGSDESSATPSASKSQGTPSPAPVKYKELPDACKAISKETAKELAPKTDKPGGKRIGTGDTSDSASCLWSGLDKFDYRQLTVSLKRFDSDSSRGSGDKLARSYLEQQVKDVKEDKDNKDVKDSGVKGVGDEATALKYTLKKKDDKGNSEKFREQRTLARSANAVVVVDYEGAGFEDGDLPSADSLEKKAEKAAKEAVASLKKQ